MLVRHVSTSDGTAVPLTRGTALSGRFLDSRARVRFARSCRNISSCFGASVSATLSRHQVSPFVLQATFGRFVRLLGETVLARVRACANRKLWEESAPCQGVRSAQKR